MAGPRPGLRLLRHPVGQLRLVLRSLTPIVVLGFSPIVADNAVLEARLGWTAAGIVLALAVRFAMWPTASHRLPAATITPEPFQRMATAPPTARDRQR